MSDADLAKNGPLGDDASAEDERQAKEVNVEAGDRDDPNVLHDVFADHVSDKDELREAQDRVLRAQAELENFRKRARRDMEDERRYAKVPLLQDLLSVLDNLERAIESAEQQESNAGLLEGVKMVAQHLNSILEQHNCQRIPDVGSPFDPNLHEAIGQEFSDEFEVGVISRVTRTGYRIYDRVVRPSQVMISKGLPDAVGDDEPSY